MTSILRALAFCLLAWFTLTGCASDDFVGSSGIEPPEFDVTVLATGLSNPVGLAPLPTGGLLVAEEGSGDDDTSAGVSMITEGRVDRILSGLPSSRDSGDLSGVPMVGLSPDGATVYTSHFGAESLLTFPLPSLKAIDAGVLFGPDDLTVAMEPLNRVGLTNAFDIAFSADGVPVVTDASGNGVAIETDRGETRFIHRFGELDDPGSTTRRVDPVPTGITRLGDEYLVTLTSGCPYPEGAGQLVAVNDDWGERLVLGGLNMPIDVTVGPDGAIWVLEFARFETGASCFSGEGYLPGTGRLSLLGENELVPVLDGLDFPGAVTAAADGSLYVSEVFAGRVLKLTPRSPDGLATTGESSAQIDDSPAASPWRLVDVAASVGLNFRHGAFVEHISADPVAMMGGGLCWLDIEGDGDMDLYLVNSHATDEVDEWLLRGVLPTNGLFRNELAGSDAADEAAFTDISAASGTDLAMRGNGCVAADLDADGDTDLYVTADGPNALLINNGEGHFSEQATAAGVATEGWSSAAAVGDVNLDGHQDLFVASYINFARTIEKPSGAFPQDYLGVANHLYLGDGDGSFTDATVIAGLTEEDRTLGALFSDLDADGDLDLYLSNDGQPNTLYENVSSDSNARFRDITRAAAVADSGSGMGIAAGDYDGDGFSDLMVTNWEAELHALYRSTGDGLTFVNSTQRIGYAGLGNGNTGWGTAWADMDHDTDLDLLIANGRVPVTDLSTDPELVQLFGNLAAEGEPGQLRDWTQRSGLEAVGPLLARGAATADFDNDGDLDVAISQIGGPAVLLRNDAPPGASLTVVPLPADPGTVASVTLADEVVLRREIYAGSSYLSSEDPRLHFGLGNSIVDPMTVTITWPDGTVVTVDDVEPNSAQNLTLAVNKDDGR